METSWAALSPTRRGPIDGRLPAGTDEMGGPEPDEAGTDLMGDYRPGTDEMGGPEPDEAGTDLMGGS